MSQKKLTSQEKRELLAILDERERRLKECKADFYDPWPWQREVIEKTKEYHEIAAWKANRMGGTLTMAFVVRCWTTGKYPDWWNGRRFPHATRGLIVGSSGEQLKNAAQKILVGNVKTGLGRGEINLPYPILGVEDIHESADFSSDTRGLMETLYVKHIGGGVSVIRLMTHTQSQDTLMGDELDWVMFDEFPQNEKLYNQAIPRIETTKGIIMVWATPEHGRNAATDRYLIEKPKTEEGRELTYHRFVTKFENPNLTEAEVREIEARTPLHERPFRIYGKPIYGAGTVFASVEKHKLILHKHELPPFHSCGHICGYDPGIMNFGALIWLMHDSYIDRFYVWLIKKIQYKNAHDVAQEIKAVDYQVGMKIPVAWGWDAAITQSTSGKSLVQMLREKDVNCLPERAHNAYANEKNNEIYPALMYMQEKMENGCVKFLDYEDAPYMKPLWEERDMYYMDEDGRIPKKTKGCRFDLIDALRYAMIMVQYAQCPSVAMRKKKAHVVTSRRLFSYN
jgi:phage terminase large subunit-like protein